MLTQSASVTGTFSTPLGLVAFRPTSTDLDFNGNSFVKIDTDRRIWSGAPFSYESVTENFLAFDWMTPSAAVDCRRVVLLVDASGSVVMGGGWNRIRAGIDQTLQVLKEESTPFDAGLYVLDVGSPLAGWRVRPEPVATAAQKIKNVLASNWTNGLSFITAALWDVVHSLPSDGCPESIILYTDGEEQDGSSPMWEVIDEMRRRGISLEIQFVGDLRTGFPQVQRSRLAGAAIRTGGLVHYRSGAVSQEAEGQFGLLRRLLPEVEPIQVVSCPGATCESGRLISIPKIISAFAPVDPTVRSSPRLLAIRAAEASPNLSRGCKMELSPVTSQPLQPPAGCMALGEGYFSCSMPASQLATLSSMKGNINCYPNPGDWLMGWSVAPAGASMPTPPLFAPPAPGDLTYPEPWEKRVAIIQGGERLAGIELTAEICPLGDGVVCDLIPLRDDGAQGDLVQGDGEYLLRWGGYAGPGPYTVRIRPTSEMGQSEWVSMEGGRRRPAEALPLEGMLALAQFEVLGWKTDDHPNLPLQGTLVESTESLTRGRIDAMGDVDCLKLATPAATGSVVRWMGLPPLVQVRIRLYNGLGALMEERVRSATDLERMAIEIPSSAVAALCFDMPGSVGVPYSVGISPRVATDQLSGVQLRVEAKDHHLGHPQISVLSLRLTNTGRDPLHGGKLYYFFTLPSGAVPYLLDYYTPDGTPSLVSYGQGRFALKYELASDLFPGQILPVGLENQIHLRGSTYEVMNKADDWSNPGSVLFVQTDRIVVQDGNGRVVQGVAPTGWGF
jgi:hypothetical protein